MLTLTVLMFQYLVPANTSSPSQDISDYDLRPVLGENLFHLVITTSTSTLIYGIFVILYTHAAVTHIKRKRSSRSHVWMFITCTITFILATADEVTELVSLRTFIHSALVEYPGMTLAERSLYVNTLMKRFNIILNWLDDFSIIIGDCIVVWRAFVLLRGKWWLVAFPSLLLFGSSGSLMASLILTRINNNPYELRTANSLFGAGLGLSLAANVVATALIGYKYWGHRRTVAALRRKRETQSEKVLALLVESGVLFCLPQATNFAMGFFPRNSIMGSTGNYVQTLLATAYYRFSAMYPTVVIALVNSQRTFDHMCLMNSSLPTISSGVSPSHVATIRFADSDLTSGAGIMMITQEDNKSISPQEV
ncbi:hypothetical protein BDZ94DRAFT_1316657 [Collybia nuda]|uniref:G protein-coupled receptor n=1 Tax=Collybia nuda TaxID=64659 RepID=A0A9P6CPR1_9AGAR|nr:hypothetical protein BDZ94DRAFT_1316657 [Collybia nuda]